MQALVSPDKEPITPFISKVRPLAQHRGVSTVLVVGGAVRRCKLDPGLEPLA